MTDFNINLTGVGDAWPVVPEGTFNAVVNSIGQYIKEDTKNIVWIVDLTITQRGDYQGEKVRYYHTYTVNKPSMAKRNMVRWLRALGTLDDTQTSGDPSIELKMELQYGKTDEQGVREVKAIVINGKQYDVTSLKCNAVSNPRMIVDDLGNERQVTSIQALEPYGPTMAASTSKAKEDLWSSFPK